MLEDLFYIKKVMKKYNSKRFLVVVSILIIVLGFFLISYDYLLSKKDKVYDKITLEIEKVQEINDNTLKNDDDLSDKNDTIKDIINNDNKEPNNNSNSTPSNPSSSDNTIYYDYVGVLEIPKVNLKKGFVSIDSKYNNVNKNIEIMKESSYPDVDGSLMVMASHNGTCWYCYFKNLWKLSLNDDVYIYYNNVKYEYKITNIYEVKKTGSISIYRNSRNTTLALVTCTWGTKDKQTVFIADLVKKTNI